MANNDNKAEQDIAFARNTPFRSSRAQITPAALEKYIPLINCNAATYQKLCMDGKMIADKTPFLKELCESTQFIRITLPRRMGKTMLLTMAKAFFEIPDGEKYEKPEKSKNYELFKDSLIFEDTNFVAKRFGQHPTIYLSLHRVTGTTFVKFKEQFTTAIREAYEKFIYLQENRGRGNRLDNKFFDNVLESETKTLSDEQLANSINRLSKMLQRFHGVDVLILIDEYDMPMNVISKTKAISDTERSEIMKFHNDFLWATFKTNEYIYKGVVAGIMRVKVTGSDPRSDARSDLTFYECNLATSNSFSRFFGFSETLVDDLRDKMATQFGITIKEGDLDLAKKWYNGFTFDANDKTEFFYNPYSMSCFLTKYQKLGINALQCYWAQGNATIKYVQGALKREEIAPKLEKLIDPKKPEDLQGFSLEQEFTLESYEELESLCGEHVDPKPGALDLLFSFLFHMGYINFKESVAVVPNIESRIFLRRQLMVYYEQKYAFDANLANAVTHQFMKLVKMQEEEERMITDNLKEAFQRFLKNPGVIGHLYQNKIPNESYAHAMMTYMSTRIFSNNDKCLIHDKSFTNEEEKKMCPDLAFNLRKSMVIVELKFHNNGDADHALLEAKYYRFKLFNSPNSSTDYYLLLGIHVDLDGNVTIKEECQTEPAPEMATPPKFVPKKNKKGIT